MAKRQEVTMENIKKAVFEIVDEATHAILEGVDKMFAERDKKLDSMDNRLEKLEVGQKHIKQNINELKVDHADTPSRAEFTKLKTRVDKHLHN